MQFRGWRKNDVKNCALGSCAGVNFEVGELNFLAGTRSSAKTKLHSCTRHVNIIPFYINITGKLKRNLRF